MLCSNVDSECIFSGIFLKQFSNRTRFELNFTAKTASYRCDYEKPYPIPHSPVFNNTHTGS